MTKLSRYYENLELLVAPGKALVIYGPRRVGKTTLLKEYLNTCPYRYKLDSGDNLLLQQFLCDANFQMIHDYVKDYELIAIDEAQMIPNIGRCLKIMTDEMPGLRIIVTGSSSFELAGQIGEPLTGRKKTVTLYPISQLELSKTLNPFERHTQLENYLIYGSYPEVITSRSLDEKRDYLNEIVQSYLFKDILALDKVKRSKTLVDLLRLLAFQVCQEVSLNELAEKLKVDTKTVARYIDLLEQSFVIYSLHGFSRNLRNEMTKKHKYFFYDNGVRNALIANFNGLTTRNDIGQLWENFLMIERIKKLSYEKKTVNRYFWRTWEKKEIDLIEEHGGKLFAYEFKWKPVNVSAPKQWVAAYPEATFCVIHQNNYYAFITS
jgi:predicted AAA+ superfamily ATPase